MFKVFIILSFYLFVLVTPVQAYLDPGTGSYITQLAIGFLVGSGYVLKLYWQKIVEVMYSLLARLKKNEDKKDS